MKKYLILPLLFFWACSGNEPLEQVSNTPVMLYSTLLKGVVTRAPIDDWNNTEVNIAKGNTSLGYTEYWNAVIGANNNASITPTKYYTPTDIFYFRGYAPRTTPVGNVLNYTLTGQEDLLLSSEVSGSVANPIPNPMTYIHLLSQFAIMIINDNGQFPTTIQIDKIEVRNIKIRAKVSLTEPVEANALVSLDTPTDVTNNLITLDPLAPINVSLTATLFDKPIMVIPGLMPTMKIYFVNSLIAPIDVTNLVLAQGGVPKAGEAYTITLKFTGLRLIPTVTVTPWQNVYTNNPPAGSVW